METETMERLAGVAEDARAHVQSISQDRPDEWYVVGGAVRDAILGVEYNDLDFVVVGETPESMESKGFEQIDASSFPVFHDDEHQEWALARTEKKRGYGYTGFEVFTDDVGIREDLKRRDLTVNSIALFVGRRGWDIVDPNDGVSDAEDGVLRHVSDAFAEDPLRVLRVARYASRFAVPIWENHADIVDYPDRTSQVVPDHTFAYFDDDRKLVIDSMVVAEETVEMMRSVSHELERMSRDRIGNEIVTAMKQARRPSRFWEVLEESGALAVLWPALYRSTIVPAGRDEHHAEGSVFDHTMLVVDRMAEIAHRQDIDGIDRARRLLMAVGHDIGKVISADRQGGIHSDDPPTGFSGHARIGAEHLELMVERLGLDGSIGDAMIDGAREHMRFFDLTVKTPEEMVDYVGDFVVQEDPMARELPLGDTRVSGLESTISIGGATIWELLDLAEADHTGRLQKDDRGFVYTPEMNREPYEDVIESVIDARSSVDGYDAMATGLCDAHHPDNDGVTISPEFGTLIVVDDGVISEEPIESVMSSCDDCRTPDSWIGEIIAEMMAESIRDDLGDS